MSRDIPDKPESRAVHGSALLEQYGIVRYATDHFVIGGYRYSRLEDAVAEARRRRISAREGS
jgi:hypothetical protein